MKSAAILVAALPLLAACTPQIDKCEQALLSTLKAPATYDRVSSKYDAGAPRPTVEITYDAQNSYGALLRGTFRCEFDSKDGIVSAEEVATSADVEAAVRRLEGYDSKDLNAALAESERLRAEADEALREADESLRNADAAIGEAQADTSLPDHE